MLVLLTFGCKNNSKTDKQSTITRCNKNVQIRKFELKGGKIITVKETHPFGQSLSTAVISVINSNNAKNDTLHDIDPIVKIETDDLDANGIGELYIFTQCAGSGTYGNIIAYTVINNEFLEKIKTPNINEKDLNKGDIFEGYMGHDTFSIEGKKLLRKFPVYNKKDSNSKPSGEYKLVSYTLSNNKLEISKHK